MRARAQACQDSGASALPPPLCDPCIVVDGGGRPEIAGARRAAPGVRSRHYPSSRTSDVEESVEEGPVALEREPKVLRIDLLVAAPLLLEPRALVREALGEAHHQLGNQAVRVLAGTPRLVHEPRLDVGPALSQLIEGVRG